MDNSSSSNINSKSPLWRKVICVGDKPPAMLVVLHESIVKELGIDEECWVEQIPTSDGIFLRVFHDASERTTREAKKKEMPT